MTTVRGPAIAEETTVQDTTPENCVNPWLAAAAEAAASAPAQEAEAAVRNEASVGLRTVFVAAHGGAGATTWAHVLGGVDGGPDMPEDVSPVVLVARASLAGIDAAKRALAAHAAKVACVLVVPAAPGRPHRAIRNELRVLGGAASLVPAPWVPALLLRRPEQATPADIPPKELARIRAALPPALDLPPIAEGETP